MLRSWSAQRLGTASSMLVINRQSSPVIPERVRTLEDTLASQTIQIHVAAFDAPVFIVQLSMLNPPITYYTLRQLPASFDPVSQDVSRNTQFDGVN